MRTAVLALLISKAISLHSTKFQSNHSNTTIERRGYTPNAYW